MVLDTYSYISTKDQNIDGQIDTLQEYGCVRTWSEKCLLEICKQTQILKIIVR